MEAIKSATCLQVDDEDVEGNPIILDAIASHVVNRSSPASLIASSVSWPNSEASRANHGCMQSFRFLLKRRVLQVLFFVSIF